MLHREFEISFSFFWDLFLGIFQGLGDGSNKNESKIRIQITNMEIIDSFYFLFMFQGVYGIRESCRSFL